MTARLAGIPEISIEERHLKKAIKAINVYIVKRSKCSMPNFDGKNKHLQKVDRSCGGFRRGELPQEVPVKS